MSRLLGLSGIKNLQQFKSLQPGPGSSSASGPANSKTLSTSLLHKPPPDSVSLGSFSNLKLTAEKLVREQASAKSELELANSKLKKLTEQIRILEEELQNALNENSKLTAKQKEDDKQWKGLESKFSSAKALCNQLSETLQQLHVQVQNAEKDKACFEEKLSATSAALDKLHEHIESLSLKLSSSEETVKIRDHKLAELRIEKEKNEASFRIEQDRVANQIEEKDGVIKKLGEDVAANKVALESLASKMERLHIEIRLKEDNLLELSTSKDKLEKENEELISSKEDLSKKLEMAIDTIKNREEFVNMLVLKFTELENQCLSFSERFIHLNALNDKCFKLAQEEKDLVSKCAQSKLDRINIKYTSIISEKNALQLVNQELNNKVLELQKGQEFAMVQHAEELRLAEEKIRKLESEAKSLVCKLDDTQALIIKLENNIRISTESSRLADTKTQELLLKLSELETESRSTVDGLREDTIKKQEEIDLLQKEVEKSEENLGSLKNIVVELENSLEEKKKLILELKTREKQLEDEKAEIMMSLDDRESKLQDAKKQYDHMLESKHLELSKHLKDLSLRNDQAINDIRRKYEVEKEEVVNVEKEKADKVIQEMVKTCDQKIAECKEECKQQLPRVQDEHTAVVSSLKLEHANKEMSLRSKHIEELKRNEFYAETELRERTKLLRSEHEAQLRALRCEHEDECRRLQDELDMQKAKEERQRALLQLQWKVMGNNPQEDQEVNSKKAYSISSTKKRNEDSSKGIPRAHDGQEVEEKDSLYMKATGTPMSNMLKNVENVTTGSVMNLPKHSRKVTHHEYEIETSNGRTVTKRKKTKSTVMFGGPRKQRKRNTPKAKTPKDDIQGIKGDGHQNPSNNIGELFTEGSLNPYAEDPYAFD